MGIVDRYLMKRGFVKAPVEKSAGFMALESAAYPDHRPDSTRIADYPTFIEAFRSMPWIYAAATSLAIAATKPDLKVYREVKKNGKTDQEEVTGEEINKLLELPNPYLSWRELIQVTVINLVLLGNQYWDLVGTRDNQPISKNNKPVEIWWVKPGQMQPVPDVDGAVNVYEYTAPSGRKKPIDASEIIHFRLPNPGSYFLGMGMMEPLTGTAILEANAVGFMRRFMENDATPPFVFNNPNSTDKAQRKRFLEEWDERHKGPRRAGRPGMLWGGMKIDPITQGTIKDTQYPELRKMNREEFLAGCGVPPSVVGLLEYANYSNMEVQQKKFWEDAEIPILGMVADKLTLKLAPCFDERYWCEFDCSKIKVLQEDEERKSRIAAALIQNGLKSPNEVLREMYNADPYTGGDQRYISMSLIPIGPSSGAPDDAAKRLKKFERKDDKPAEEPKGSYWTDPERKKALWINFDKRVASEERAMAPEVEKYLTAQASAVKAKISAFDSPAAIRAGELFDVEAQVREYRSAFEGRYRHAFEQAGEAGFHATKGKLWIPPEERRIKDEDNFYVRPEHLEKLVAQLEKAARFFNETTWREIKASLTDGLDQNMTVEEIAQQIWARLKDRAPYEARRIASTEMTRTENFGQVEGYKQNEAVDMKGWNCEMLETSRDDHIKADGQEVGLNEDFVVGGYKMAWPGDDRAPAEEVVNCRCSTYPVVRSL